jgi:hypothetical protein
MSFFEMPAWQPPTGYRIPAWLRPPETMVPGIVPVELLLARTETHAVLVTALRAYPTGLEFALTGRSRPDLPDPRRPDPTGTTTSASRTATRGWSSASPTATPQPPTRGAGPAVSRPTSPTRRSSITTGPGGASGAGAPATGCGACPRLGR